MQLNKKLLQFQNSLDGFIYDRNFSSFFSRFLVCRKGKWSGKVKNNGKRRKKNVIAMRKGTRALHLDGASEGLLRGRGQRYH
jgi:hypothetical protein